MSNIQFSINKIKNSKLNLEPFPHLIVDNFLPQEDYEELLVSLRKVNFSRISIDADLKLVPTSPIISLIFMKQS